MNNPFSKSERADRRTKSWKTPTDKPQVTGANLVETVGKSRQPDFFCIGTEKAGTTWLWFWMNKHPQIGVPVSKELRFFDTSKKWDPNHFRTLAKYLEDPRIVLDNEQIAKSLAEQLRLYYGGLEAYYRIFGSMSERVVGEVSPQYCVQPLDRIQEMRDAAPAARIIYLLRDPVDRLISGARMVLQREGKELSDASILQFASNSWQREFSNSIKHLQNFETIFGKDSVDVIFYDDIKSHPQNALDKMCNILGVDSIKVDESSLARRINAGQPFVPSTGVQVALFKSLKHQYRALEERFPERVASWKKKHSED